MEPSEIERIPDMKLEDFRERAPKFFKIFDRLFDNDLNKSQSMEMLGSIPITSPLRKMFLLIGPREVGKSAFLEILAKVFELAVATVEFTKLMNPEWRWNVSLMKALLNYSTEKEEVVARSPERIKRLTIGGSCASLASA